ncbi:MAG: sulfite oxidase [Gemmatimonadota bacterium]
MSPTRLDGARLSIVTHRPLNAEPPLTALDPGTTPLDAFYVRSNFPAPELDAASWRLRLHGRVRKPATLSLDDLRTFPEVTRRVTLECAGNGRKGVEPIPPGTPWGLGAAGTGDFTGVRLRDVLTAAGVADDAVACVFTGADAGEVEDGSRVRFQRSLPLEEALDDGPLLAWAMNGEPLTRDHGHPVRLVVPRWYAVASVKWLVGVEVADRPFEGWFQTDRYMYRREGHASPVTTMRVRSLLTSHADGARVPAGVVRIGGIAWSGEAPIARVELQVDDGPWTSARLTGSSEPGLAVGWEWDGTLAPGTRRLGVRAVDGRGRGQPERSAWNELGYGNNGIHRIRLAVD